MVERNIDFHPDEPNKKLWLELTQGQGRPPSPKSVEWRQRVSRKAKETFADKGHHWQDPDVEQAGARVPDLKRTPPGALCLLCGGPLWDPKYVALQLGETCLKNGLATGKVLLKADGTYQIRKRYRKTE